MLIFNGTLQQWCCIIFEIKIAMNLEKKYNIFRWMYGWRLKKNIQFSLEEILWRFYIK